MATICGRSMTAVCGCCAVTIAFSGGVLASLLQEGVSVNGGLGEKPAEPQSEADRCDDDHDQRGHRQNQGDEL
jgi:hypothetical protein